MAHILLAEDDESLRKFLAAALVKAGHTVTDFGDGSDAWECLQGFTFDLLLTDIVMPYMDGGELARFLLEQRPDLRVLYMSGYADDSIINIGLQSPNSAFLAKPFASEMLAHKVRQTLDRRRNLTDQH